MLFRSRAAEVQSRSFGKLGRFAGPFTGGLFWRFDFADRIDVMALYAKARRRNILLSPGTFFRTEAGRGDGDGWMRVNVSRCEADVLPRVLEALRTAALAS